MIDLFSTFCKLCGHFIENIKLPDEDKPDYYKKILSIDQTALNNNNIFQSPTWLKAYKQYKQKKTQLKLY